MIDRHGCFQPASGFLLIGLIAGWLAGLLTKGRGLGLANDLIVGVLGAFLGGLLFWLIGLAPRA